MALGAGTYVLVLRLEEPARLRVGRLGELAFGAGWYLYVGSALSGLQARLTRHLRSEKRLHWHIDYVLQAARIEAIWYREERERLECAWATELASATGVRPFAPGFGASDCRCHTHLFSCSGEPTPLPDCRVLRPPYAELEDGLLQKPSF